MPDSVELGAGFLLTHTIEVGLIDNVAVFGGKVLAIERPLTA
jgi:hypothetical protein